MFVNYILIWGSRLYGKVDQVGDHFHVATKFGHLWYIPLLPLGSWIVLGEGGKTWTGIEIGLSGKSILMAWLRTVLLLGGIALLLGGFVGLTDNKLMAGLVTLVAGLACVGGFIATKTVRAFTQPSYERARELAELVGMTPAGRLSIEELYGRVTPEQAADVREALAANAQAQAEAARAAAQEAAAPVAAPAPAPVGDPNLAALEAMGMVPEGTNQPTDGPGAMA